MSARARAVTLPASEGLRGSGLQGVAIEDASDDQLRACLEQDRRFLHGGRRWSEDEGQHIEAAGRLSDLTFNPHGCATPEAYIAEPRNSEANRRVVERVHRRIQAIEAEQDRRAIAESERQQRDREAARTRLASFLESAPSVERSYQSRAGQVDRAWKLLLPIVNAVETLRGAYSEPRSDIHAKHARLRERVARAADALGVEAPEVRPLSAALPEYDQVRRALKLLAGAQVVPDTESEDTLPAVGDERLVFDQVVKRAK